MSTQHPLLFPVSGFRPLNGILLTAAIASGTILLSQLHQVADLGLGALTLAILAGIIIGNLMPEALSERCASGITLSKHYLLRGGIILYGFNLTFQQISHIGYQGLLTDIIMLSSTFLLTCLVGIYVLKLDRQTVWLIGAGSSICGAAAVLATGPVVKASPGKVAVAVATVVIFGTAAIFLYPLIWEIIHPLLPGLSAAQFGIYTGSTIHEVAQVVAAGHSINSDAENNAVIAKMLRVMMLAPFLMLLGQWMRKGTPPLAGQKSPVTFPWFALIFILVACVNSFHLLPAHLLSAIHQADNLMLAMAMAALGLTTKAGQLKQAGLKPLLLGFIVFIWLIVGGGLVNLGLWQLIN